MMAKRKAAGTSRRKAAAGRTGRSRKSAKKPVQKRAARKPAARKRPTAKAARANKTVRRRAAKPAARKRTTTAAAPKRSGARTTPAAKRVATKAPARKPSTAARTAGAQAPPKALVIVKRAKPVARKAPALSRERRTIVDDDVVQTPPSTLDLDRTASSARSGRRELRERFEKHTETGPALTGGDVDADWESAYSVGDEAPGGDSPTPDQDIVDDIGRAVGVEYQDNEELKGEEKIVQRDRHRWELDPASSEDYEDR
jgi:hypothetical protein